MLLIYSSKKQQLTNQIKKDINLNSKFVIEHHFHIMYDQLIPEPIHDHKFTLGEGPFYRKQTNEFLQVDINEKKIFVFNLNNGSLHSHEFDEKVSCFSTIETRPHLLIVAGHNNLYLYDMNTKKCEAIKENFFDRKRFRFNDGKCDPVGR